MEGNANLKRVVLVIAIMHPIEAFFASRMAKKRGRSPALYFLLTLIIGFPILIRLRKIEPVPADA